MHHSGASLVAQTAKNLPAMRETWIDPQVEKVPWGREWLPTPVFLPGELHGQRSLQAIARGFAELDMTEQLML